MADQAVTTAIRESVATQLETISVADGYRSDVGADVRTEPSQFNAEDGPRVTVWPATRHWPEDAGNWDERSIRLLIEVQVPVSLETPLAAIEAAEADVEEALKALHLPGGLPLRFVESVILDRPDGMPSICSQMLFASRYR